MSLPAKEAKLRAEALSGIGCAISRLDDAARAAMYNHTGKALWRIARAEGHLKRAKKALRAWQKERGR